MRISCVVPFDIMEVLHRTSHHVEGEMHLLASREEIDALIQRMPNDYKDDVNYGMLVPCQMFVTPPSQCNLIVNNTRNSSCLGAALHELAQQDVLWKVTCVPFHVIQTVTMEVEDRAKCFVAFPLVFARALLTKVPSSHLMLRIPLTVTIKIDSFTPDGLLLAVDAQARAEEEDNKPHNAQPTKQVARAEDE